MYVDVEVIVAGAVDERQTFTDDADGALEDLIARLQAEVKSGKNKYPTEVYALWHEHDPDCART